MTQKDRDRKLSCETGMPADGQPVMNGERTTAKRTRFAQAIARSEFGRHYWDDSMAIEMDAARKRKRKRKPM